MPYKDKDKQLEYQREWYKQPNNNEKTKNNIVTRKRELKRWFKELKNSLKCASCGENTSVCLDFHHDNEKNKDHNISSMIKRGFSKEKILEEIEKCTILCANCHRKFHAGLIKIEK